MTVICLQGLEVFAFHGVAEEERRLGGRFLLDIELKMDRFAAEETDALEDTVDYGRVAALAEAIATGTSFRLLERLAGAVADGIMAEVPVDMVTVRVTKTAVPLPQKVAGASVKVERVRATGEM